MGRNSWMQTPAGDEIMDGKFHAADGLAIVFNPSFPYRLVRGVAFDFRVKACDAHKAAWNHLFAAGSLVTALAQGWILGAYVTGCHTDLWSRLLAAGIALTLPAAYAMLGVGWLLMKTEGDLQRKALRWGQGVLWPMGFALMGISLATPVVSQPVFNKWFVLPAFFALLPISLACVAAFFAIRHVLAAPRVVAAGYGWIVFVATVAIFVLAFCGLAYSIYPSIVMDRLMVWEAASATESLIVIGIGIGIGVAITLPVIVVYTVFMYRVLGQGAGAGVRVVKIHIQLAPSACLYCASSY